MYPIINNIKIREGLTLPQEFEISFDLYVYSNKGERQTVLRFTNTDKEHGVLGARIPMVRLDSGSNKLEISFRIDGKDGWNVDTNDEIVLDAQNTVIIKQVQEGSAYKFKVFLNGTEQTTVGNNAPDVFENVWLTTGEDNKNSVPVDGRIENLRVWPGNTFTYFMLYFLCQTFFAKSKC